MPTADRLLLLRLSGEIYTKARQTRLRFLRRLGRNVEDALEAHGIPHRLEQTWSRLYLEASAPGAAVALAGVFGLQSVSEVERRGWEGLGDVVRAGEEFFRESVRGRRFAVRAGRRGNRGKIPFTSHAVEIELGRALLPHGAGVDLERPEVTARVEVEPGVAFFFLDKVAGHGGLPVGVEGRAVALVSGGFDSAVAAWLMLKRGVQLDYLFANLGGAAHRAGVLKVVKVLADRWSYGYRPQLHEVDLRPMVEEMRQSTRVRHWQIVLKRLMLRAAEAVAKRGNASALVTGDAIGQVSSQTLQNLAVVSQAVALPILRPLVGFNKEEILDLARAIGVYELAAEVGEYCGLGGGRPATRARLQILLGDEAGLDLSGLDLAVAGRAVHDLRGLDAGRLVPAGLEVEALPPGAAVLDLRARSAYEAWHYPGALHLDLAGALAALPALPAGRPYVVVCEVGLKSTYLAERMQEAGLEAHCFKGGLKGLMELAAGTDLGPALLAPAIREQLREQLREQPRDEPAARGVGRV